MTKADIIKLAKEAGFLIDTHAQKYQPNCILSTHGLIDENLKRFANLVAAHKAEVITAEAYRCGYEAGVVAERESCAKLCEEIMQEHDPFDRQAGVARRCLNDIRARTTP